MKQLYAFLIILIFMLSACGNNKPDLSTSATPTSNSAPIIADKKIDSVLAFDMYENDWVYYSIRAYNRNKDVIWQYDTEKVKNNADMPLFNYCRNIVAGQIDVFFLNKLIALDIKTGSELWKAGIEADYGFEMAAVDDILYFYIPSEYITYLYSPEGMLLDSISDDAIPKNFERPFEEIEESETTKAPEETRKATGSSSESGSDYKEAYKKVFKYFEKQIRSGEEWNDPRTEYALYDLNTDGTPELIVGFGTREKTSNYYFYTYTDGKAKLISGRTDVYDEDDEDAVPGREELYGACDRGVIGFMSMKGYEWANLYSMSGKNITSEELFFGEIAGGNDNYNFREISFCDFDDMRGFNWSGNPEYDNYKAMENLIRLHADD